MLEQVADLIREVAATIVLPRFRHLDSGEIQQKAPGDVVTVALPPGHDDDLIPDLIADLVRLGVRVHAVEPGRISLEQRLLDILRTGSRDR